NLKIKELPSSKPDEKDVCPEAKGFVTLFTGLDLDGWQVGEQKANWKVGDNVLKYDGKVKDGGGVLMTTAEYSDVEGMVDVRLPKDGKAALAFGANPRVVQDGGLVELSPAEKGGFVRYVITRKGGVISATRNGEKLPESKQKAGKGSIALTAKGSADFMN